MKNVFRFLLALLAFTVACKSDTVSSPPPTPAVGANYMNLADNQTLIVHCKGVETEYSQTGDIVVQNNFDNDGHIAFGPLIERNGYFVHPITAFNFQGEQIGGGIVGYVGQDANTVYGLNTHNTVLGTGIQKDVSSGASWSVVPGLRGNPTVTVQRHLDTYQANGITYQDVIALSCTYNDVSVNNSGPDSSTRSEKAKGTLYFAKGGGFIYGEVESYELIDSAVYLGTVYRYKHETVSGTIVRTN